MKRSTDPPLYVPKRIRRQWDEYPKWFQRLAELGINLPQSSDEALLHIFNHGTLVLSFKDGSTGIVINFTSGQLQVRLLTRDGQPFSVRVQPAHQITSIIDGPRSFTLRADADLRNQAWQAILEEWQRDLNEICDINLSDIEPPHRDARHKIFVRHRSEAWPMERAIGTIKLDGTIHLNNGSFYHYRELRPERVIANHVSRTTAASSKTTEALSL